MICCPLNQENIKPVEELYLKAFPKTERTSSLATLLQEGSEILVWSDREGLVGFTSHRDLGEFVFIEYLAVFETRRGARKPSEIFRVFSSKWSLIVCEIERPGDSEWSTRRLNWYIREGFFPSPHPYQQPPYGENPNPLPLLLVSYPIVLEGDEFERVVECINRVAYFVK